MGIGKSEICRAAGWLGIQGRVGEILSLKSKGQTNRLEMWAEFLYCNLEAEYLPLLLLRL